MIGISVSTPSRVKPGTFSVLARPGLISRWTAGRQNYSDAGTTPCGVGEGVYLCGDSAGPYTVEQATGTRRPILRQHTDGKYEWEFDKTVTQGRQLAYAGNSINPMEMTIVTRVRVLGNSSGPILSIAGGECGVSAGIGTGSIETEGTRVMVLFGAISQNNGPTGQSGISTFVYRFTTESGQVRVRQAATTGTETSALSGITPPIDALIIGGQRLTYGNESETAARCLSVNCRVRDVWMYDRPLTDAEVTAVLALAESGWPY